MEIEEYKFDHFKNIDEVMYYFNYWYKENDYYSIDRYLSLRDFNYISNKYQELQQENRQLKTNWNKLKEIVKSQSDFKLKVRNKEVWFEIDELLSKMEELEKGV